VVHDSVKFQTMRSKYHHKKDDNGMDKTAGELSSRWLWHW